jgi:hypothetical protein
VNPQAKGIIKCKGKMERRNLESLRTKQKAGVPGIESLEEQRKKWDNHAGPCRILSKQDRR